MGVWKGASVMLILRVQPLNPPQLGKLFLDKSQATCIGNIQKALEQWK